MEGIYCRREEPSGKNTRKKHGRFQSCTKSFCGSESTIFLLQQVCVQKFFLRGPVAVCSRHHSSVRRHHSVKRDHMPTVRRERGINSTTPGTRVVPPLIINCLLGEQKEIVGEQKKKGRFRSSAREVCESPHSKRERERRTVPHCMGRRKFSGE